jgi:hypothetical protein
VGGQKLSSSSFSVLGSLKTIQRKTICGMGLILESDREGRREVVCGEKRSRLEDALKGRTEGEGTLDSKRVSSSRDCSLPLGLFAAGSGSPSFFRSLPLEPKAGYRKACQLSLRPVAFYMKWE